MIQRQEIEVDNGTKMEGLKPEQGTNVLVDDAVQRMEQLKTEEIDEGHDMGFELKQDELLDYLEMHDGQNSEDEHEGAQEPFHGSPEESQALDGLPTVVYLTDDGDSFAETRSVISDGLSDADVVSGFSELSRALEAMEQEEAQRVLQRTSMESSVYGTSPDASIMPDGGDEFSRNLVKLYNDLAVRLMEGQGLDQALQMLQKAEKVLENDESWNVEQEDGDSLTRSRLRAITYNNLGCLYRRKASPRQALEYLLKSLDIETNFGSVQECASTHLNLCASYSALRNYGEALMHAEKAVLLLQGQLWGSGRSYTEGLAHVSLMLQRLLGLKDEESERTRKRLISDANVLAMAYHNAAVEHERLGQMKEAQVSFTRASNIGNKILGSKSSTTIALVKAHKQFQHRYKDTNSSGSSKTAHPTSSLRHAAPRPSLKVRQGTGPQRIPIGGTRANLPLTSKPKKARGTQPLT